MGDRLVFFFRLGYWLAVVGFFFFVHLRADRVRGARVEDEEDVKLERGE